MKYKVEATPSFLIEAKRLSKKYPSLKKDIEELAVLLSQNPTTGTPLGKDAYKITKEGDYAEFIMSGNS